MPKTERVIRVFVSAPGDVQSQVKAVARIVEQLNQAHGKHLRTRLQLIHWRSDVVPGLGADPQEVINTQIAGNYDIFVGILWTRFGTPTPRAGSGTEEEFNQAHSRWRNDAASISVMMYFSDVNVSPSSVDPEQLAKVRNFRSRIQEKAIFCEFKKWSDFRSLVYDHLSNHIHRWSKTKSYIPSTRAPKHETIPVKAILERERVPFVHGQRADFLTRQIPSKCRGFRLKIKDAPEPYWRAGFALAPDGYLSDERHNVTITRHFLFHIGRGSSAAPTERTGLNYQAYYEDRPITYTTPFGASDPIEIDVTLTRDRRRITVSLGDALYQRDLDLRGFRSLYILAWADHFGPFRIPVELTLF